MARKCGKCGETGHNSRTCGRPTGAKPEPGKGSRRCGKCGQPGHNARTCLGSLNPVETDVPEGHLILQANRKKEDRIPVNGIVPVKGLWIVSPEKKIVRGQIQRVKRRGQVVWMNSVGLIVESEQDTIINSGYEYWDKNPIDSGWDKV